MAALVEAQRAFNHFKRINWLLWGSETLLCGLARRVEVEAQEKCETEEAVVREVQRARKIEEAQREWTERQEGFTCRGARLWQDFKEQKIDAQVFRDGGVELAWDKKEFERAFEERTTSRVTTPAIEVSSDGEDELDDEVVEVPTIKVLKVPAAAKKAAPSKQKDRSESVVYRSVEGLVSTSQSSD
jgi:hypothetical protein